MKGWRIQTRRGPGGGRRGPASCVAHFVPIRAGDVPSLPFSSPDPATSPGQGLPAATLTDREGDCGSRGARVLRCSYRFPGAGNTRRRKPGWGVAGHLTTLHHHSPKLSGLWALAPQDRGCRDKAGRPPEASFYARSPRQSVQRPMDRPKLLHHNLLTSPGLSFLIGMIGAIPKSQACLKDK